MSRKHFDGVFPKTPVILPVIHVRSVDQAVHCARQAQSAGANGVWLIDHNPSRPPEFLLNVFIRVRADCPNLWIGVNFLGLSPLEVVSSYLSGEMDGLWIDNLGIVPGTNPVEAERVASTIREAWYPGLIFAGVAFKYQQSVADRDLPELTTTAGRILNELGVITTSGPGTGEPPNLAKIIAMKEAANGQGCPLAIASGMTPENIGQFLPYTDAFLVGTCLEDGLTGHFHTDVLDQLVAAVRST